MGFFEKFRPKHENIENGKPIEGKREYSHDDARREINANYKIQQVISGESPLEPTDEEVEHIQQVSSKLRPDDMEMIGNNIDLLTREIAMNNKKIKQLEESIKETEALETAGERAVISAESYRKAIESLEKLNEEKKSQIEDEERKITELPSLN